MKSIQSAIVLALLVCLTSVANGQKAVIFQEPELATTHHQIQINGSTLGYTAHIGLIPICENETGQIRGRFGFVYYALEKSPDDPPRPVIFVWNGGPGANSTTVHFVGFGPWRLRTSDDPANPTPVEPQLYENDATWLTFADLVFVDPIGTGFARPSRPEFAAEFYNTLGDIASTAEFIRVFRLRFDLLNSPLFLAGESYGTWRASGAAEILQKRGVPLAGVLLISGGMAMGKTAPDSVRTALFVPARTSTAFYFKKLSPDLMRDESAVVAEATKWAVEVYAPAWENRDSLSDADRDRVIAELARYTGIPVASVDRTALAMSSRQFNATLLAEKNATLGRYDTRVARIEGENRDADTPWFSRGDVMMQYLRNDLGFKTDLAYQGIESGWHPNPKDEQAANPGMTWVWNQGEDSVTSGTEAATQANQSTAGSGDGPPGGSQPWMLRAMQQNPKLKLFVAAGKYDSLNSHALNAWIVSQLDPALAQNITLGCYSAGHIMYDTRDARLALRDDVEAFVKSAIQTQ